MSDKEIIIQTVPLEEACEAKINTNNHHDVDFTYGHLIDPDEYDRILYQSRREVWGHLNPFPCQKIEVDSIKLAQMSRVGSMMGHRPNLYEFEPWYQEIESQIEEAIGKIKSTFYFIRTSSTSPKDGKYGIKCMSTKEIVDTLVTSARVNRECSRSPEKVTIYIQPFSEEWEDEGLEYRVFVYHGRVTGISQYCCHSYLKEMQTVEHQKVAEMIIDFCEEITKQLPDTTQNNWTIDVIYLNGKNKIELVEVNSFGAEMAAGSGLFHWITDRDTLYDETGKVCYRYIIEN